MAYTKQIRSSRAPMFSSAGTEAMKVFSSRTSPLRFLKMRKIRARRKIRRKLALAPAPVISPMMDPTTMTKSNMFHLMEK